MNEKLKRGHSEEVYRKDKKGDEMMSKELQLLTTKEFNGHVLDCYVEADQEDKGSFWATREQIGRLLGYSDPNNAITIIHKRNKERLDKFSTGVKLTQVEGSRTVTREVTVYNFKGLLEICRYSNQPTANAVIDKLWEIADEIRRTGMYLTDKAADAYVNNPELFKAMAERCSALEQKVAEMEKTLNERYSLSVLGETVLCLTGAISFKDGATFLCQHGVQMGQNRLFQYCREQKLLCSRKGRQWNKPTQKAMEAGLFNLEISGGFRTVTLITPTGLKYLTDELIAKEYPLLAILDR